jgi:hypothetical protein
MSVPKRYVQEKLRTALSESKESVMRLWRFRNLKAESIWLLGLRGREPKRAFGRNYYLNYLCGKFLAEYYF